MKKKPAKKKRNGDLFLRAAKACDKRGFGNGACSAFSIAGAIQSYCGEDSEQPEVAFFANHFRPEVNDFWVYWWRTDRAGQKARVIGLLLAKAMWESP